MKVTLTRDIRYPTAPWIMNKTTIAAGTIVPAIEATNLPHEGCLWLDIPELEGDPYGVLLHPEDYTNVTK